MPDKIHASCIEKMAGDFAQVCPTDLHHLQRICNMVVVELLEIPNFAVLGDLVDQPGWHQRRMCSNFAAKPWGNSSGLALAGGAGSGGTCDMSCMNRGSSLWTLCRMGKETCDSSALFDTHEGI